MHTAYTSVHVCVCDQTKSVNLSQCHLQDLYVPTFTVEIFNAIHLSVFLLLACIYARALQRLRQMSFHFIFCYTKDNASQMSATRPCKQNNN